MYGENPPVAAVENDKIVYKNISDNVQFMNELNQVATYVQLPLLINNKSAHGDLYVYTNKNNMKKD